VIATSGWGPARRRHQTKSPTLGKERADSIVARSLGMPSTIEPGGDLGRVEADQPPDLQIGHPSLGDKPANVANAHPEPLGELVDGEELWQGFGTGYGSP